MCYVNPPQKKIMWEPLSYGNSSHENPCLMGTQVQTEPLIYANSCPFETAVLFNPCSVGIHVLLLTLLLKSLLHSPIGSAALIEPLFY